MKLRGPLAIILVFWVIFLISIIFPINSFGIVPRRLNALVGILCAPFLHQNWSHLLANSLSFLIFGQVMLLQTGKKFYILLLEMALLTGLATWCFGRTAMHIGASGVVFAMFGYILSRGIFSKKFQDILISLVIGIFYGATLFGVLPQGGGISWESHLFGFIVGVILAKKISLG
ncbi:rhomboid family intramembrane serine protease [Bacteriovoracaceae bacterium]|nr:rhomboid family intramembrane serine protease [Bacteriovoracaceae bacterium]